MKELYSVDDKMTVFYSRRTGEIKAYTTGVTDMGYFGDDAEDMEMIYNFIIVDLDMYVLSNINQFKIENGEIRLKESIDLEKYL